MYERLWKELVFSFNTSPYTVGLRKANAEEIRAGRPPLIDWEWVRIHCDTIWKMRLLLLVVCHNIGAPLPAKFLPCVGDEWRSEFYNMWRMLLNQRQEAHSRLSFLRRSAEFGRTGLLCQDIEVEAKPV